MVSVDSSYKRCCHKIVVTSGNCGDLMGIDCYKFVMVTNLLFVIVLCLCDYTPVSVALHIPYLSI